MEELGGLRKPLKNSTNDGWRNASFRGFADYMQSKEFEENLGEIIAAVLQETVAIMCAEALPWRCHRALIADALTIRGLEVGRILGSVNTCEHKLPLGNC